MFLPRMPGSAAYLDCQSSWLRTAYRPFSSSPLNPRPRLGVTPNTEKKSAVTISAPMCSHVFEDVVLRPPVKEIRIRSAPHDPARYLSAHVFFVQGHQLIGVGKRQRAQENCVDNAEDGCVCSDAKGEGQDRDSGEAGRIPENPEPVANIL